MWFIIMYTNKSSRPGTIALNKNMVCGVYEKAANKGFASTKYVELIKNIVNITSEIFNTYINKSFLLMVKLFNI